MSSTVTGKISIGVVNNAGVQVIAAVLPYSGDAEALFIENVPIGTNTEYDISWLTAKSVMLAVLGSTNATIKTNSSSVPIDTITLLAGVPQLFPVGTNPFAHDVTKIFVTNAALCTLTIYQVLQF